MRTIFVENFTQNIFGNLKFFAKVHILRENWEKAISSSQKSSPYPNRPLPVLMKQCRKTYGRVTSGIDNVGLDRTVDVLLRDGWHLTTEQVQEYARQTGSDANVSEAEPA